MMEKNAEITDDTPQEPATKGEKKASTDRAEHASKRVADAASDKLSQPAKTK